MNTCYSGRSSRPARLFSFGLLDGPQVRLRRPHVREAPACFGLSRFTTAFMNNPGYEAQHIPLASDLIVTRHEYSRDETGSIAILT
jgi:hypothetical protein